MSSLLKKITKRTASAPVKINRRLFTFFVCVLISVFFWLLMSLAKEYVVAVSFPVKYVNLPKDKVFSVRLPDHIEIQIKSKGFNLLVYQYIKTKETIVIDLKDAKMFNEHEQYLLTNSGIDKISSQFSSNITLKKIIPDTIYFSLNKKITKKVPVKIKSKITFKGDYQLTDSIKSLPEMIEVSGASDEINKIKFVETAPLALNNIDKSTKVNLLLLKNEAMKFVELSHEQVAVTVNVAKYTEASIDLPIQIENLPTRYNLKIFPDKVNVKYQVSFENYEKVTPEKFKAIVDYKAIEKSSSRIKIQLIKSPLLIKNIKLSPEKVEYILRK